MNPAQIQHPSMLPDVILLIAITQLFDNVAHFSGDRHFPSCVACLLHMCTLKNARSGTKSVHTHVASLAYHCSSTTLYVRMKVRTAAALLLGERWLGIFVRVR